MNLRPPVTSLRPFGSERFLKRPGKFQPGVYGNQEWLEIASSLPVKKLEIAPEPPLS
jgi:hypothetical protein